MNKGYLFILPVLFFACSGEKKEKAEDQQIEDIINTTEIEAPPISEEVISDIIQQVPSPLEISVLLKQSGTMYNKNMLNTPEQVSLYNNSYKQAINLGIYGADMGYTNIYEQNQDALHYLNAIKTLANNLRIGQFFQFETIKKLATNSKNLDSLLLITTKNFNDINNFLQEQKRSNLSILLLTGGWLEALHITCQVLANDMENTELKEKVGEQKIILQNIMLLLSYYEASDPNIAKLSEELNKLQELYNEVEIVHTYEESTFEEVNGRLVIKNNSKSEIQITPEQIQEITALTKSIRNNIIN